MNRQRTPFLFVAFVLVGLAIGIVAGFFVWGYSGGKSSAKVVIAIQPTEAAAEIAPRAKQLERYLESKLGVGVEVYVPTTYAAAVEALRFRNADVAFMSAWPSYIANRIASAEVLLAEVREVIIDREKKNEPFYYSYWVVPKNSRHNSFNELRGKKVCFPSPISTSGYVFPVAKLVELGLVQRPKGGEADPKTFFGEVIFGGGYGQCWASLKAGQVDVSIIAGDVSEKLYLEVVENTKVLEKQGPIPSHGVVFSKELKNPLREKIIATLLESDAPELRELMRKFISGIFVSFKPTTTVEHMSGLQKSLELTGFRFTDRLW